MDRKQYLKEYHRDYYQKNREKLNKYRKKRRLLKSIKPKYTLLEANKLKSNALTALKTLYNYYLAGNFLSKTVTNPVFFIDLYEKTIKIEQKI